MSFAIFTGRLPLVTVFGIISFSLSVACFAQMPDEVVLKNLRENTKLKHFEEMQTKVSSIINTLNSGGN